MTFSLLNLCKLFSFLFNFTASFAIAHHSFLAIALSFLDFSDKHNSLGFLHIYPPPLHAHPTPNGHQMLAFLHTSSSSPLFLFCVLTLGYFIRFHGFNYYLWTEYITLYWWIKYTQFCDSGQGCCSKQQTCIFNYPFDFSTWVSQSHLIFKYVQDWTQDLFPTMVLQILILLFPNLNGSMLLAEI